MIRSRSMASGINRATRPSTRESAEALSDALRRDLAGRRVFRPFSSSDFRAAAWAFVECGYFAVDAVRDMDGRERDLSLPHAENETRARGRNCLADLRLTLEIFAWFEHSERIRDAANTGFGEIAIDQRMSSRAVGFSASR